MGRNNADFYGGADPESTDGGGFDPKTFFTKENEPLMVRKESRSSQGVHRWMELPDGRKSPVITTKD
jgi:hypothetical protein